MEKEEEKKEGETQNIKFVGTRKCEKKDHPGKTRKK